MAPEQPHKVRRFTFITIVVVAVVFFINAAILYLIKDDRLKLVLMDLITPVWNLLATSALFLAARRSASQSCDQFWAWCILTLAQLSFTLADILWLIIEVGLGLDPFPSISDGFYLLYYPLFFIGVFLLPARPLERFDRYKLILDIGIIMLSSFLGFWIYLLAPLVAAGSQESTLSNAISLGYPIGDLILLAAVLNLLYRQVKGQNQVPLFLLGAGAIVQIVIDTVYAYRAIQGTYVSGTLLDVGWPTAYAMLGMAGLWQAWTVSSLEGPGREDLLDLTARTEVRSWRAYIPYLWIALTFFLLISLSKKETLIDLTMLTLGVSAILVMAIARQMLMIRENASLFEQLRSALAKSQQDTVELQMEIVRRERAEEQITHSLREKEVLLREVYHRVKNNLQVIGSLLNLQSAHLEDDSTRQIFQKTRARINAMALVHEKLYQSRDLTKINFTEYIETLIQNIKRAYLERPSDVDFDVQTDPVWLRLDTAIPCGLILNELIANSLKHAFQPEGSNQAPKILVRLQACGDESYQLTVADNGVGLPERTDWRNMSSLGMQLIDLLAGQIGGEAQFEYDQGTRFTLVFSEPKYREREWRK